MKRLIIFTFALALGLSACKKDQSWDNSAARDNSTAENYFSDMFAVVNNVSQNTSGIRTYFYSCIDTVIVDTTVSPRTAIIDFGTDDCIGLDGKMRKGKLNVTYTGRYRDAGTVITVTPENYYVDGSLVQGSKTITNMGLNGSGQPHYHIVVNGTITTAGTTVTYLSDRTRTWVAGYDTADDWFDDEYDITGSGSGINRLGNHYTASITTALHVETICPWIESGEMSVTPDDGTARIINFGSGACNPGYTITVNGNTVEINGGD
jgi:hypothetical protein